MRLVIANKSVQWVLKGAQRMLFACAALLLGYCVFVLADIWMFQNRQKQNLERMLRDQHQAKTEQVQAETPILLASVPGPDGLIGRIEILRLQVSVAVVEGTGKPALRHAAGHIVGTALPGQLGNVGIAGHRDTFFHPLRNIQRDDIITLTTLRGEFRYRVVSTKIVSPYDVDVLDSDGTEVLTLVTCYPFYFVGPAPERFIVRAQRVT